MKLKMALCDDDSSELEKLAALVGEWAEKAGHRCEIRSFLSAEAFFFQYEQEKDYDLLLLDVEMGGMSGTELARRVRSGDRRVEIIFITAYFEFFGEGFEVEALHYLIKPVSGEKLLPVLDRAVHRLQRRPPSLIFSSGGETRRVCEADILYIEAFLHEVTVYTQKGSFRVKESISSLALRLGSDFYRVHRSYLISLRHLVKISRTVLFLDNGAEIPLARGKYDGVNRAFIEWGG
ncbi:MAG: response regulator transcription factor [Provencibacterium sp.]|nr:response regulator transcription factor [Provencibacterium sp.]